MKIYTRTGDKGTTALLGGDRVNKDDLRIEAYGTVDELNSNLGLLRDQAGAEHEALIKTIQNDLFAIGSTLSAGDKMDPKWNIPVIDQTRIDALEKAMDEMDKDLPALKNFVLPGGNSAASQAHIARCVCRRAERRVVGLAREHEVPDALIIYLNRLSDLLFLLARTITHRSGSTETSWKPNSR